MRRAFFLVLLLAVGGPMLLAACGPTGNSPDAVCERETNDDPQVKLIIIQQSAVTARAWQNPDELPAARNRAKRACLARLGVLPAGGGVEQVRQPESQYNGLF